MICIFTSMAVSLLSKLDNIATPCSVKTFGGFLKPIFSLLDITFCDFQSDSSSLVIWNIKSAGKHFQADLTKQAVISREIIGRYKRNEVSPSVEVAKKIADTLEVSLDYLTGDGNKTGFDKRTLKLIDEIEELEPSIKDKLLFLANAIIRDAKTGKAYSH